MVVAILTLLAGIGVFLVACTMMSTNLEAAGSTRLKKLFSKTSENKWLGVGIGALGTAAIQSSGATTVMVIGFVNAAILTLTQAAYIIFGANIGTTITGQIVALGMFGSGSLSTTVIFSSLAGVGAFCMAFSKTEKWKTIGGILAGFGMLFIGLNIMSSSMETFAENEAVIQFIAQINNAIILVFIGAILTAIVQSSSVMTSVAITMVVAGLITIDQGIYLTMGSNIGSCVVAVIAGLSSGANAKRTAAIHLIFNTIGVVFFLLIAWLLKTVTLGNLTIGTIFVNLFPSAPQLQLAMFHTVFNVIAVLLIMPITNILVSFVQKIIHDDVEEGGELKLYYLDENMLRTPVIALGQMKNEIINMAGIAIENFNRAIDIICTLDYKEVDEFKHQEKELNYLNSELNQYVMNLSEKTLGEKDRLYLNTVLRSVADLERIGDYAENIIEYADHLQNDAETLSNEAIEEVHLLKKYINDLFEHTMRAYRNTDLEEYEKAEEVEDKIDAITEEMAENHLDRLARKACTPNAGAQYLKLSADTERIGDHLINVAKTIKKLV